MSAPATGRTTRERFFEAIEAAIARRERPIYEKTALIGAFVREVNDAYDMAFEAGREEERILILARLQGIARRWSSRAVELGAQIGRTAYANSALEREAAIAEAISSIRVGEHELTELPKLFRLRAVLELLERIATELPREDTGAVVRIGAALRAVVPPSSRDDGSKDDQ